MGTAAFWLHCGGVSESFDMGHPAGTLPDKNAVLPQTEKHGVCLFVLRDGAMNLLCDHKAGKAQLPMAQREAIGQPVYFPLRPEAKRPIRTSNTSRLGWISDNSYRQGHWISGSFPFSGCLAEKPSTVSPFWMGAFSANW